MKKTVAKAGVLGVVLLGITECSIITAPAVMADYQMTQSFNTGKPLNILNDIEITFSRGSYKIVTTEPWKKPEIANQKLSEEELMVILKSAGFEGSGLAIAKEIVFLESGNRPYAHNDNHATGDNSYGLFQINMFKSLESSRLKKYGLNKNEDLFDPLVNARIAYQISDGGKRWSAWTTYKLVNSSN